MKNKIFGLIKTALFAIAIFAAATPSQFETFQPECPEKLKKYKL